MKLTTHLHLQLALQMSGAIPPLTHYALKAWTGTTLPFSFIFTRTEIADIDTQMETPQKIFAPVGCSKWGVKILRS
jgi:hypothetical protein